MKVLTLTLNFSNLNFKTWTDWNTSSWTYTKFKLH